MLAGIFAWGFGRGYEGVDCKEAFRGYMCSSLLASGYTAAAAAAPPLFLAVVPMCIKSWYQVCTVGGIERREEAVTKEKSVGYIFFCFLLSPTPRSREEKQAFTCVSHS